MKPRVDPATYNEDYFEHGPILGISGYMNYSWMPELTIRMAHKLIMSLPIREGEKILDFGCAKGYLVKAMRILDVAAYGVDVSAYAIAHVDGDVREYCRHVTGGTDPALYDEQYDWLIAKDVFEHLIEDDLVTLLGRARSNIKQLFAAVPLAAEDESGKYIIPEYDRDITHRIAKSFGWWQRTFESQGWQVAVANHEFPGCKDHWTRRWAEGNGFFVLKNPTFT